MAKVGKRVISTLLAVPKGIILKPVVGRRSRRGGQWAGLVEVSQDFDEPDAELESDFYEGPVFPGNG